jgi:hypothetical protein
MSRGDFPDEHDELEPPPVTALSPRQRRAATWPFTRRQDLAAAMPRRDGGADKAVTLREPG